MKKKIVWWKVILEITRRCNLACKHCIRGDAQCIDMSNDTIDAFLDQTEIIADLELIGGEPMIARDRLKYLFDGIKKRGIKVYRVGTITNGTITDDDTLSIIKDFCDYIFTCRLPEKARSIPAAFIGVSYDDYHMEQGVDSEIQYWILKIKLFPYAVVSRHRAGTYPVNIGRATKIKTVVDVDTSDTYAANKYRRIAIIEEGSDITCPGFKHQKAFAGHTYIPCNMYIDVGGGMAIADSPNNNTWNHIDEHTFLICNVSDDILPRIRAYNEKETLMPCAEYMQMLDKRSGELMVSYRDNREMYLNGFLNNILLAYSRIGLGSIFFERFEKLQEESMTNDLSDRQIIPKIKSN